MPKHTNPEKEVNSSGRTKSWLQHGKTYTYHDSYETLYKGVKAADKEIKKIGFKKAGKFDIEQLYMTINNKLHKNGYAKRAGLFRDLTLDEVKLMDAGVINAKIPQSNSKNKQNTAANPSIEIVKKPKKQVELTPVESDNENDSDFVSTPRVTRSRANLSGGLSLFSAPTQQNATLTASEEELVKGFFLKLSQQSTGN